jgi:hypothetical protein
LRRHGERPGAAGAAGGTATARGCCGRQELQRGERRAGSRAPRAPQGRARRAPPAARCVAAAPRRPTPPVPRPRRAPPTRLDRPQASIWDKQAQLDEEQLRAVEALAAVVGHTPLPAHVRGGPGRRPWGLAALCSARQRPGSARTAGRPRLAAHPLSPRARTRRSRRSPPPRQTRRVARARAATAAAAASPPTRPISRGRTRTRGPSRTRCCTTPTSF